MNVDGYMKALLTVIAGALVWLCAVLTPVGARVEAQATAAPTRVVLVGWQDRDGFLHNLSKQDGLPTFAAASSSLLPAAAPVAATPEAASSPAPSTPPPAARSVVSQPATPKPSAPAYAGRCQATTKKGTQCSRTAKAGSSYCWQHGG